MTTEFLQFESLHQSSALAFGPDTASYNGLMDAYAKKGDRCSCDKAVALLEWMNNTTIDGGDVGGGRRLDVVTYTAATHALSNNGRAKEAHDLLLQTICSLQHYDGGEGGGGGRLAVRPDRVVFSAVVDAWERSGEEDAVEGRRTTEAEWILYLSLVLTVSGAIKRKNYVKSATRQKKVFVFSVSVGTCAAVLVGLGMEEAAAVAAAAVGWG